MKLSDISDVDKDIIWKKIAEEVESNRTIQDISHLLPKSDGEEPQVNKGWKKIKAIRQVADGLLSFNRRTSCRYFLFLSKSARTSLTKSSVIDAEIHPENNEVHQKIGVF